MIENEEHDLDTISNSSDEADQKDKSTGGSNLLTKLKILTQPWTYGWVVAILTIFIAYFAFTQLNTIKTDMIIGKRAWITVKKVEYGPKDIRNDSIAAKIVFINNGSTPALNFNASSFSEIGKQPPDNVNDSAISSKDRDIAPIGPEGLYSQMVEYKGTIDKGIWAGIHNGSINFYVWGIAEYYDVFNEKRKTEFCFSSSKSSQTMIPCEGMNKLY